MSHETETNNYKGWQNNASQLLLKQPALFPGRNVARVPHSQPFLSVPIAGVHQRQVTPLSLSLATESLSLCPQIIKTGLSQTRGQSLQQLICQASFSSY